MSIEKLFGSCSKLQIFPRHAGYSVVVQGLYDDVKRCCNKMGLKVHTTNHSLGIWGKKEKLPSQELLEITTMCGHGMVPASLVKDALNDIKTGKSTVKEAALKLTRPCVCGTFNPDRAERLLAKIAEKK